ncbi:uncharacterized protein LOC143276833 [Babylonia areolata]|uniref:uncharacterized protein LOC143276833 n=1 Tax=Babylonia areolata TaxID=304850 RepID=UPI003FD00B6A
MDASTFTCITPEVTRLVSYQRTPLPNHLKFSVSNSPAKLAKAGFMRRVDAVKDDVCCDSCGIVYGDWEGESPLAVHRVLNEKCPILNSRSAADDINHHPSVVSARRQLFPADEPDGEDGTVGGDDGESVNSEHDSSDDGEDEVVDNSGEETADNTQVDDDDRENGASVPSNFESEPDADDATPSTPVRPAFVSVLSRGASFPFPFEPPVGGFSMLFASRRLKTFSDTGCPECVEWAEEGFVFRSDTRDVQCVFCSLILPFNIPCEPQQAHAEKSIYCPRVQLFDVGNVSTADEQRIRLKNLQRQLKRKSSLDRHYAIHHPQYEEESARLGTYDNWTLGSWDDQLQPSVMSQAGFYFTGLSDKVVCYSCGVGLYRWRQGSDPWEQHARHMPACPHLVTKGQHFLQQAAQAQVLTEVDIPTDTGNSGSSDMAPGQVTTATTTTSSPPGSLTLDTAAVTAALHTNSQYTAQQVRHAVLTFFSHTSRFPTKDILLGTLKAADENFTTVCEQRETIHQKDTALQQKDTVIQQKDTALQQKDTAMQQKDTALQQKDTVIQQKDTELQQHVGIVEQQNQIIQQHQEELERRRREMRYQELQISSLKIQMEALLAERRQAGALAAPLQAPPAPPAQAPAAMAAAPGNDGGGGDTGPMMCDIRCKVCLSAESNTIFRPCHHVTCCSRCAHQLYRNGCPVCRAPITDVLPAYIS